MHPATNDHHSPLPSWLAITLVVGTSAAVLVLEILVERVTRPPGAGRCGGECVDRRGHRSQSANTETVKEFHPFSITAEMNIYFACSITGGREFESVYQAIVRALVEDCHTVLTAHLAESGVTALEAAIDPHEVYARDMAWIRDSDVLIAEVSTPSHGVGYEIGFSLGLGKPVLALCQEGHKISKMISGNSDPYLSVKSYQTPEDATLQIGKFINTHKLCL